MMFPDSEQEKTTKEIILQSWQVDELEEIESTLKKAQYEPY